MGPMSGRRGCAGPTFSLCVVPSRALAHLAGAGVEDGDGPGSGRETDPLAAAAPSLAAGYGAAATDDAHRAAVKSPDAARCGSAPANRGGTSCSRCAFIRRSRSAGPSEALESRAAASAGALALVALMHS